MLLFQLDSFGGMIPVTEVTYQPDRDSNRWLYHFYRRGRERNSKTHNTQYSQKLPDFYRRFAYAKLNVRVRSIGEISVAVFTCKKLSRGKNYKCQRTEHNPILTLHLTLMPQVLLGYFPSFSYCEG